MVYESVCIGGRKGTEAVQREDEAEKKKEDQMDQKSLWIEKKQIQRETQGHVNHQPFPLLECLQLVGDAVFGSPQSRSPQRKSK